MRDDRIEGSRDGCHPDLILFGQLALVIFLDKSFERLKQSRPDFFQRRLSMSLNNLLDRCDGAIDHWGFCSISETLGGELERFNGFPNPSHAYLGVKAVKERSSQKARDVAAIIAQIKASGAVSLRAIAAQLNAREVPAPRGGQWQAKSVQRVLERIRVG
jgi:hypothetical protein